MLINEVVPALTWKMAKKMRKASTMSATMYEKAAKVKAIFHAELRVAGEPDGFGVRRYVVGCSAFFSLLPLL